MKKVLFFCLLFILNLQQGFTANPKTIMLVLGSDNPQVLKSRIELGYKLYTAETIDKIIVSGGCGAHMSSICEATMMYDGLVRLGVDSTKIYKEENAKTTVQNYVFSRVLKDELGNNIIQKGDTVVVVSDHWHAIAVAARLKKYDAVQSRFFISGDISPKENDKLDYVSIFNGEVDNEVFVRKALWLTPQALWKNNEQYNYVMDSMIYHVDHSNTKVLLSYKREAIFDDPRLANQPKEWFFIDNGDSWYIKILDSIYEVNKSNKSVVKSFHWDGWIEDLPFKWLINGFNTGIIIDKKLILFSNNSVLLATKHKNKFVFEREGIAADFIEQWPFSWGKSNVAGAYFDRKTKAIMLFRNREYLQFDKQFRGMQEPLKLNVKWVNNQE